MKIEKVKFYTCVNRHGTKLLYRGYTENGRFSRCNRFKPTLYMASNKNQSGLTSIDGVSVEPIQFDDMKDATDFVKSHEDVSGFNIYGNTNYMSQFIYEEYPNDIEFDLSMIDVWFLDIEVKSDGFPKPNTALGEITAISIMSSKDKEFHLWGTKPYDVSKSIITQYPVHFHASANERQLLEDFLFFWSNDTRTPDVVSGWNIETFDIPYLVNRMKIKLGDKYTKLSPWGIIKERRDAPSVASFNKDNDDMRFEIYGIQQLDLMALFKKYAFAYGTQESYRLDFIASVVLDERKLSYDEFSGLNDLWERNPQRYYDYNLKDVLLTYDIDQKTALIPVAITMAYRGGVNYETIYGTTAIWDSIIYRDLMRQNKVIPPFHPKPKIEYPGAYVKEPKPGMYPWVMSFDVASLYPSIIVQWNMSPETIIGDILDNVSVDECLKGINAVNDIEHTSMAVGGVRFKRDSLGVIPSIIARYYADKKSTKRAMLDTEAEKQKIMDEIAHLDENIETDRIKMDELLKQKKKLEARVTQLHNAQISIKTLMNSLYGALGNRYFRYTDFNIATAITLTGQFLIQIAGQVVNTKINELLNTSNVDYVIYGDTDSLYINFNSFIEKYKPKNPVVFLDKISNEVMVPLFKETFEGIRERFNCKENRIEMVRDVIADNAIFQAKKRYIMTVLNSEGVHYTEPKLKIHGIEAVKSSTPMKVRNALKDTFRIIMTGDKTKTQEYIKKFRKDFNGFVVEDVAFPRGISDINKFMSNTNLSSNDSLSLAYQKGTPIHVRGSIIHNQMLIRLKLGDKYKAIGSGDKIKFVYLKMPNSIKENVISFVEYLPKEFALERYVDYDMQFSKTFLAIIEPILNTIGWQVEEQNNLDSFFV
jgi:DNA polymerase elongation subunit (family B)